MTSLPPAVQGKSLACQGSFNPAIVHPAWLAMNELITAEEAREAKITFSSDDVIVYELAWCRVQVTQDSFVAELAPDAPSASLLVDLVLGIFRFLAHTPVRLVGIGHTFHLAVPYEGKSADFTTVASPDAIAVVPGGEFRTLEFQGERQGLAVVPAATGGHVKVRVQPSVHVDGGLYVSINDVFEQEPPRGARLLEEVLTGYWEPSCQEATRVAERLIEFVTPRD